MYRIAYHLSKKELKKINKKNRMFKTHRLIFCAKKTLSKNYGYLSCIYQIHVDDMFHLTKLIMLRNYMIKHFIQFNFLKLSKATGDVHSQYK